MGGGWRLSAINWYREETGWQAVPLNASAASSASMVGRTPGRSLSRVLQAAHQNILFFYSVPSTTYTFSPRICELSHATFELQRGRAHHPARPQQVFILASMRCMCGGTDFP